MSDVDDLAAALALGDPDEHVPIELLKAMAAAAIRAHWILCPHADFITERAMSDPIGQYTRRCQWCGVELIVKPGNGYA